MDELKTPQITMKDTEETTCSCGSKLFQQAISLRRVSALLSGTGREEFIPVAVIVCLECRKAFERSALVTG